MWIATFVKLHRIFKIHNFLIFKWNINLISCQKLKLAFVRECDGQPVSPVLQPTYTYVAPCSGASPVARGTSLQTPICSGHKIWRDQNTNYLSRIAAPLRCVLQHTGLSTVWPLRQVTRQAQSGPLSFLLSPAFQLVLLSPLAPPALLSLSLLAQGGKSDC